MAFDWQNYYTWDGEPTTPRRTYVYDPNVVEELTPYGAGSTLLNSGYYIPIAPYGETPNWMNPNTTLIGGVPSNPVQDVRRVTANDINTADLNTSLTGTSTGTGTTTGVKSVKNSNPNLKSNLANSALNVAGGIANKVVYKGYSNGLETKAGKIINSVGSTAAQLIKNPLLRTVVETGVGAISGIVNAGWGYDIKGKKAAEQNTTRLNQLRFTPTDSTKGLVNQYTNADLGVVGLQARNGFATNKGTEVALKLGDKQSSAFNRAFDNFMAAVNQSERHSDGEINRKFISAFGGPLQTSLYDTGSATGYSLMSDYLTMRNRSNDNKTKLTMPGIYNSFTAGMPNTFGIGGVLQNHGANWDNGVTVVNEGGTHEQNPNQGVQMGVDPLGIPNMVEEGEVIHNDYVFSNRVTIPEDIKKKYGIKVKKNGSFADAAKRIENQFEDRPNDPISKRGMERAFADLREALEEVKEREEAERAEQIFDAMPDEEKIALMQQVAAQDQAGMQQQMPQENVPVQSNETFAPDTMVELQAVADTQQPPVDREELRLLAIAAQEAAAQQMAANPQQIQAYGGKLYANGGEKNSLADYSDEELQLIVANYEQMSLNTDGMSNEELMQLQQIYQSVVTELQRRHPEQSNSFARGGNLYPTGGALSDYVSYFPNMSYDDVAKLIYDNNSTYQKQPYNDWLTALRNNNYVLNGDAAQQAILNAIYANNPEMKNSGVTFNQTPAVSGYNPLVIPVTALAGNKGYKAIDRTHFLNDPAYLELINTLGKDAVDKLNGNDLAAAIEKTNVYNNYRDSLKKNESDALSWLGNLAEHGSLIAKKAVTKDKNGQWNWNKDYSFADFDDLLKNISYDAQNPPNAPNSKNGNTLSVGHLTPTARIDWSDRYFLKDKDGNYTLMTSINPEDLAGDNSKYVRINIDPYKTTIGNNNYNDYYYRLRPERAVTDKNDSKKKEVVNPLKPKERNNPLYKLGVYGPLVGLAAQVAGLGKPDTKSITRIAAEANAPAVAPGVEHIYTYQRFLPRDVDYDANRLLGLTTAAGRMIQNASLGNAGIANAGLLANAYNAIIQDGDLRSKALEQDNANRNTIAEFNRKTDEYNATADNTALLQYADAINRQQQSGVNTRLDAAKTKASLLGDWYGSMYANTGNFFNNLMNRQRDDELFNQAARLAASGAMGGGDENHPLIGYYVERDNQTSNNAFGGKLKKVKKKKGGLTY